MRDLRPRAALLLALGLLGLAAPQGGSRAGDRGRQILWQRSLEDALAIAAAENRPLLVAVNMDGESASDRIVRERYRDPAFVELTRHFVCVVASAFRHAPRDHDDAGRRIPCPRLGEVTCGEHIALEPILFDRYLGGERIAPRHAVILADGAKMTLGDGTTFDLSLLFDLHDLDQRLAEAVRLLPPPKPAAPEPALVGPPGASKSWIALARDRRHSGRLALESALAGLAAESDAEAALSSIASAGDKGSIEAFRILLGRSPPPSSNLLDRIASTAETLKVQGPTAAALRERITGLGAWPGAPGLGDDGLLLPVLGRLDGASAANRSMLLAYAALRGPEPRLDVDRWWSAARDAPSTSPPTAKPTEKRTAEAIEGELSSLDTALDAKPADPELLARYGRASLELAQSRIDSGGAGAGPLLQDADRFLERAWTAGKREAAVLFDRAKAAYLSGRYEDEERVALQALSAAAPAERVEAERWVGDAAGRLLAARSGGDANVETAGILRGARALLDVAGSGDAGETDWISLGSFLGALGMRREELAVLQLACERLPESTPLRSAMNASLAAGGRIDLAPPKAEWIAARHPDSADVHWHAGYARILAGEERRREEDADGAIGEYEKGSASFRRCAELRPEYKENVDHYLALCALGRGFANLIADRRAEAAKCLAEAVAIRPAIASIRDGLDREPVDLVDGALEWRESGASPVDVPALVDQLERTAAGDAYWVRAVSDSELREALRADGRGAIVEGDRYLRVSIDVARRAAEISDDEETKRALAQPLTILAERLLKRGDPSEARPWLAEAAPLVGEVPPAEDAGADALNGLAARLREKLGEARPRFRPGR
jgi:tetratricopeptide (TPR) repeat protein